MAKKDKVELTAAHKPAVPRPVGVVHPESAPAAPAQTPGMGAASARVAPPQQLENGMVQQILERQAVFGF